MRKVIFISPLLAIAVLATICLGQTAGKPPQTLKDKYHVVQIGSFDVQSGIDVPHEYVEGLPQELAKELKGSKKFSEVLLPGENPSQKDSPVLRLSGAITGFDKGNRGKRYIGLGMGAARIFVTLDYVDQASGQLITEDKAFGELSGGLFGGDPKGVVKEVAKSIAGTTKLVILRNLSTPPNVVSSAPISSDRGAGERQILPIKASDLTAAQNKINELAAAGYRLLDFKVTGNRSAEIAMEKSAAPPDTYRYLLLHALSPGNVQKNLNKGAAEGYRRFHTPWQRWGPSPSSWRNLRVWLRQRMNTGFVPVCVCPVRKRMSLLTSCWDSYLWKAATSWDSTSSLPKSRVHYRRALVLLSLNR